MVRVLKKRRIVSIAEFSIHPIGTGTSVSRYVKRALQDISKIEGLEYQVTPMATILEAKDVHTILKAVEVSHSALRSMGAKRISSILRIDERLDKPRTMKDKTASVKDWYDRSRINLYSSLLNRLCMKRIGIGCPLLLVS